MLRTLKFTVAVVGSIFVDYSIYATLNQSKSTEWYIGETQLKSQSIEEIVKKINIVSQPKTSSKEVAAKQLKHATKAAKKTKNTKAKLTKNKPHKQEESKVHKKSANIDVKENKAIAKITQQPKLKYTPPKLGYPSSAIKNNEQGHVRIKANINSKGQVIGVHILQSSGFDDLDQAAIKWFEKLVFTPAKSGFTNVATTVEQTISFNLKEQQNA
ncbi:energy transducer TonB [Francisella sp. LA112445]|uniref:energy transducer TonB n=1 Tax=Francisella sp. LA112445 TaxID=1395624 RepID=UPI001788AA3C|nr:energy transducer TonB [Francisella sp. LA112445]QIW10981.1 TonB family protein [Francisella sp. LA112445]